MIWQIVIYNEPKLLNFITTSQQIRRDERMRTRDDPERN